MASDECESYKDRRHLPRRYARRDWDRLAARADYSAERKAWHGAAGALTLGSKLRASMRYRYLGLAIGRVLRLGSRPTQPGDVAEYERCKAIIMHLTAKGKQS